MAMKIKTGDLVQVMRGKDKGKRGKVLKVIKIEERMSNNSPEQEKKD